MLGYQIFTQSRFLKLYPTLPSGKQTRLDNNLFVVGNQNQADTIMN